MNENYYKLLGVNKDATDADIKKAYKKLVIKYHPDRVGNPKDKKRNTDKMSEINNAYKVLSNQDSRAKYDNYINRGGRTDKFHEYQNDFNSEGFNMEDDITGAFHQFFSQRNGSSGSSFSWSTNGKNPFEGFDFNSSSSFADKNSIQKLLIDVNLTLEEWYVGTEQEIKYKRKIKCKKCNYQRVLCKYCRGSGTQTTFFISISCEQCNGNGYNIYSKGCENCIKGCISSTTTMKITIPRFCRNKIIIKKYGDYNGIDYGDVLIKLKILDHKDYSIKGDNIYYVINLTLYEFLKGTTYKLTYLDGNPLHFNIPPLSTSKIIMKNKGIYNNQNNGDLIINVKVSDNENKRKSVLHFMDNQKK